MPSVAVVGAGIAGLAVAVELKRRGARVVVVETRYPGSGNSTRNVGRVRRMQLTPELTSFAVRALEKWKRVARLVGRNPLLYETPYAWVLYDGAEVDRLTPLEAMWREHDARTRVVGPDKVLAAVPVLAGGERAVGAALGSAAIVHHDPAVYAYLLAARQAGVDLRAATAEGVETTAGRVTGLRTSGGLIAADAVVNAAGARSRDFARACGVDAPDRPVRREVLVTEPRKPFVTPAVTFYRPSEGWFNQTLRGELVAGVVDPDEPDGLTEDSSLRFLCRTARVLLTKAPRLGELRVIRQWAGVYELTPDRLPLLGEHRSLPGLFALSGWSGRGFALAPLSAELVARQIVAGERDEVLSLCDPDRFRGRPLPADAGDYYAAYDATAEASGSARA